MGTRMSEKPGLPARGTGQMPENGEVMEVLSKLLELETARVAIATKQAESAAEAGRIVDADNERQFKFHMNRFEKQHEHRTERWRSRNKRRWVLLGAAIGLPILILIFLFFGNEGQRLQAIQLISHAMTFGAGGGLAYYLATRSEPPPR